VILAARPTVFDADIAVFNIAGLIEALTERVQAELVLGWGLAAEISDHRHRRLLRPRRQRTRRSRGADKREERAAVHRWVGHSITSSAMARTPGGIVRPSILAVLRLMTNSNLVGCMTGRSAGLAPLRIRPTYVPAWR